jgi:5-methyltetrahydrofolate--homocysteine methyltransferase
MEFIAAYADNGDTPKAETKSADVSLDYAIEKGLKAEARDITSRLLETTAPMDIINGTIIPALDKIGNEFETGKIFLPQLLMSAGVAQEAFEVLKIEIAKSSTDSVDKGTIVIATVKGDVHDIGKNIVRVLLENYGYNVVDLGKDVEYQAVVDAVKEHNCRLVGLSALMTTTLPSMADTIKLIRENNLDCKVMVGGAVLTPEYADNIGADYYTKDAKQSVDIAKEVLG